MRTKTRRTESPQYFQWGVNLLFASFFLLCGVFVTTASAEEGNGAPRIVDAWQLPDTKGNMVDFSPRQGEAHRLVLFWATWCPYCKALMPHLEQFRQDRAGTDFGFYALNIWEEGDAEAYVEETDFNFRLVLEADAVAKNYGVKGTPGLFLINDRNEVLYERKSGTSPKQVITDLEFALARKKRAE